MVTEVVMTVWIRLVQGSEKVKDQDVEGMGYFVEINAVCLRSYFYQLSHFTPAVNADFR